MSSTGSLKQKVGVTLMALVVVILSVLLTAHFSGRLSLSGSEEGRDAYRNVTFTDAVLACEGLAEQRFGPRIQTLVVDNHSSRYDNKFGIYKIFLQADLFDHGNTSKVTLNYINCFVKSSNGRISKFENFADESPAPGQRQRDDTNLFGFPK